jgi:hypothetical protein
MGGHNGRRDSGRNAVAFPTIHVLDLAFVPIITAHFGRCDDRCGRAGSRRSCYSGVDDYGDYEDETDQ